MTKNCTRCNQRSDVRPGRSICRRCENLARNKRRYEPLDSVEAEWHNNFGGLKSNKSSVVKETLSAVEEHRLKVKNAELLRQVKSLTEQLSDAQFYGDLARQAAKAADSVEPIAIREKKSGLSECTVQVLASDWHLEEEVRPEAVAHRNRYNLEISAQRVERFFQATRFATDFTREAYVVRDMILWLGGDLITNYLHDDNIESNLLAPVEAIAFAYQHIKAGIEFLLTDGELDRIVVVCNDGNHGRLTDRTRSATRVQNSIEWLLYKMLADAFAGEDRIEFILPQGSQTYFDVYDRVVRYTHGDETRYGGGVGGITIPIYKAMSRWDTVRPAALTVMGHYHQRINLNDLIVNGSLIGFNAYSQTIGARFEPPVQDFSVLDPKRWRGLSMPLFVSSTEDDQG